jgi:hypothetical protein
MFADAPDFKSWFPEPDGLPRPDWKAIRQWIRSHSTAEHWGTAYEEITRTWLDKTCARLGGSYGLAESNDFHLLSELDEKERTRLLAFLEESEARILRVLAGVELPETYGKHVVMRFTTQDDYYRYISYFLEDGSHPTSGATFLFRGYMHIAYPHDDVVGVDRKVLAHELTHNLFHALKLPLWLNEALAMLFEKDLAGARPPLLTRELADEHRAYWNSTTIQNFWRGVFYSDVEAQKLGYSLARILMDFIVTDLRPNPPEFRDFILHAEREDAGEAAARNYLGVELGDLVSAFLGPGEWSPRLKA